MNKRAAMKRHAPLAALAALQLVLLAIIPARVSGKVSVGGLVAGAVTVFVVSLLLIGLAALRKRRDVGIRYAPLIALAVIQLLIMGVAPSRAPAADPAGELGFDESGAFNPEGLPEGLEPGETGEALEGGAGATGGTGSGGAAGVTDGAGAAGGAADTSHCVAGRQYDPAIYFYAPPCRPKFTGSDNGGATYQGVNADTVKIVRYFGQPNEAVDAIARAQGAYFTAEQTQAFALAAAKFINSRYELYGRRMEIKVVKGDCSTVPPEYDCLRQEVKEINGGEKPYFLVWNTPLASPFFDEASALRLPNAGGWNFRDSFSNARAPYHWDIFISGTKMAQHVGEFYCKQLHGKKAVYADGGRKNPSRPLWDEPRRLGVISTNDPENLNMVKVDFKNALAKCGASYGDKEYYYAQDISTAQQQRDAALAKMMEPPAATTIICFCEHIAPHFLFAEAEENRYYPEYISPGNGIVDLDRVAQPFGTVVPPPNVQWNNGFGLSSVGPQDPQDNTVAHRVWKAAGQSGNPPYEAASVDWVYYAMVADLIQASGPILNPVNMAKGIFAVPPRGGGADIKNPRVSLSPGNYALVDDMRLVYWSKTKPSSYNGSACSNREDFSCSGGSYVNVLNQRFLLGQYPTGDFVIPPYNQR